MGLALTTEMPTPELLLRRPYGRTKALISRTMAKNILGQAVYQLFITFGMMFYGNIIFEIDDGKHAPITDPPSVHFTMIFNSFVMMTLFNEINARKIHGQRKVFIGLFTNPIYYIIWFATFIGQVLIIQYAKFAFSTAPLNLEQWIWCIFFGLGTLVWQQIITTIPNSCIPHSFSYGRQPPAEPTSPIALSANEVGHGHHHHHHESFSSTRSGQILWIRGLTRLQTQIRVVNAFRHGMDSQQLQQATSNPNIQRVLQKQASLSGKRFSVAAGSMLAVQPTSETTGIPCNTLPPPAAGVAVQGTHCTSNTRITIPEQSFSHTETAV